jgi:hypothetical protein
MNRSSMLSFGHFSATTVGALYLLVMTTHFMLPRIQLRGAGANTGGLLASLAASPGVFVAHYWLVVLVCLFTVGIILAVLALLEGRVSGSLAWGSAVGLIGAGLGAADFAFVGLETPRLAERYAAASPHAQSLLLAQGLPHLDPCFLAFALLGIWALSVGAALLRARVVPLPLALIGLAGGALYVLACVGSLAHSKLLIDVTVALGGSVVAPMWNLWFGACLGRAARDGSKA